MAKINLKNLRTCSLNDRKSKVNVNDFSKIGRLNELIPDILAGKNFKNLLKHIVFARKNKKPVIFMFGAHVIKCGLSPIVIDLMRKGFITSIATNGASLIHDFELSAVGKSSEDVKESLATGDFGTSRETAEFVNSAAKIAAKNNAGLGETFGRKIIEKKLRYRSLSILAMAAQSGIPVSVHVAIGTDVVHQHGNCDGAAWGKSSYTDFVKFCGEVARLGDGGVVLNFGDAVILPEVFLKAVNAARNLGHKVRNFTTANFDMVMQYRAMENFVSRPVAKGGQGYYFIGHHELMLPLLYKELMDYR